MDKREQIVNHIKKYFEEDVKLLYDLMVHVLLGNNDFHLVNNADSDDLRPIIDYGHERI